MCVCVCITMFSKLRNTAASSIMQGMCNGPVFVSPFLILTLVSNFLCFLWIIVPVLLPIPCGSSRTANHSVLPHPPGFSDWFMEKATDLSWTNQGLFLRHINIKAAGKNSVFSMGMLSLEASSISICLPLPTYVTKQIGCVHGGVGVGGCWLLLKLV